jgi:hypothetical protein
MKPDAMYSIKLGNSFIKYSILIPPYDFGLAGGTSGLFSDVVDGSTLLSS